MSKQAQIEALLNGPASPPPAGTVPEFHKPASLNTVFYLSIALCITFSSSAVLIRIYTRHFLVHSMGYDDYVSIVAWMSMTSYLILGIFVTRAGLGVHMWDLQLKDFSRLTYWFDMATIAYNPSAFFAKLSILLQYSRIFNPTGRANLPLFLAIRIGIASVFIFYFVRMFVDIFQCNPREKVWNPLITTGHCLDGNAAYKASGIFNVISDFAILIMPMPSVWKLQMSLRKKLLTTGVFALGFLACVTSIMRTCSTSQFIKSSDKSYVAGPFGLWSMAELTVGVITGCLPVMPKFFKHVGPKVLNTFSPHSEPSSISGHDLRSKMFKPTTLAKIKPTFVKHSTGLTTSDSDTYPYARHSGEYYTLDEVEAPQHQANCDPVPQPGIGVATRRNDLEYKRGKTEVIDYRLTY